MTFGELLRRRRHELRLTLAQVGERACVAKGYLSGIETGKVSPPSPEVTRDLAEILQLDEGKLVVLGWLSKCPEVEDAAVEAVRRECLAALGGG